MLSSTCEYNISEECLCEIRSNMPSEIDHTILYCGYFKDIPINPYIILPKPLFSRLAEYSAENYFDH